jgi:transposase
MGEAGGQEKLFAEDRRPADVVVVNDRCVVRTEGTHRVVLVAGVVLAQYAVGDRMAEAYAMASLVEQGWADQNDVGRAFNCSARTVRRFQRRLEMGGLAALGRSGGYPRGRARATGSRLRLAGKLKREGASHRAIARRLGVTPKAVRKLLRRLGWKQPEPHQTSLPEGGDPNLSAFSSAPTRVSAPDSPDQGLPAAASSSSASTAPQVAGGDPNLSAFLEDDESLPSSADTDPADRKVDRLFAYLGLLDDAAPLFRPGTRVPRAGVLLAIPALIASGILSCARDVYGSIGPAFYGLRTSIVALLFMALWRIKRPENIKEHSPDDLGRVLGLDRAPEVKTLRRKLSRLAALGRAAQFGRALAECRVAARGAALGFLYVDGHVRVYHGKHPLPKAHVARMRISMPATTDYWVNDVAGEPLFVLTAEANAGLVKMLPPVLAEIRRLVGERRVTVVFDRGGWSPKLFQQMIDDGFDILTYRKGRFRHVPRSRFQDHSAVLDGRKVTYRLADQGILLLGGKLRLRQVTRLSDDGQHQTPIVTSRRDLPAIEVAWRMFERWRQENFFKYLDEEFALDALADYAVEPDDPERDVPNPARSALEADIRQARAELRRLQASLGIEAVVNAEQLRRTMRGFKIANAPLTRQMWAAHQHCAKLEARRAAMPARVPVRTVLGETVVKLATERKQLTNLIKMVAYQAESDLLRLLAPHYKRADDEGRTLIQSALSDAADIAVTEQEIHVCLAPLSSPHRTRAIASLCDELNRSRVRFPGTRLVLRYAVAGPRQAPKADKSRGV